MVATTPSHDKPPPEKIEEKPHSGVRKKQHAHKRSGSSQHQEARPEKGHAKQTRVVKLKRSKGKVVQDCDVYIGRRCARGGWNLPESKWHCPFTLSQCGSAKEIVKRYQKYIATQPDLLNSLHELNGKVLGCWCKAKPSDPCHGDVLVELVQERFGMPKRERQEGMET